MKGILIKMASKRALPSAVPGGGGGVGVAKGGNEHVGSLLDTFFECLFLNAFSDAIFEPSDAILELLGTYLGAFFFLAFSYLGSFLKIVLPCRRELKNQGPRVTEITKKSNKNYS